VKVVRHKLLIAFLHMLFHMEVSLLLTTPILHVHFCIFNRLKALLQPAFLPLFPQIISQIFDQVVAVLMTLLQPLIIVQFCGICLPKRIKTLLLLKVRFQGEERLCGENLVVGGGSDR